MDIWILRVRLGPCCVELLYGIVLVTLSRLLLAIRDFREKVSLSRELLFIYLILVITKCYEVRARSIKGQNALALVLCFV